MKIIFLLLLVSNLAAQDTTNAFGYPLPLTEFVPKVKIVDTAGMLNAYVRKPILDSTRANVYTALATKQAAGNYLSTLTSGTLSIGYTTGNGGAVTQLTSKTTAVTLNKLSGRITMNGAALAAGAEVAFTLTNSTIAATDVIIVNVQSVGTAGAYLVGIGAVGAGSCSITVSNASAGSLSQAIVLNFAVFKSSIN